MEAPPDERGDTWEKWLRPGAVVGRFELVREIGRGGFGVVWEARDRELGRAVAFKAVRAAGPAGRREERLLQEAELAARLSHPNIVTLHDVGRSEHGPYLVLELLRGRTLADALARGALPPREAIRVGVEVAGALAHAHARGVVHRDLKPGNVFLQDQGPAKVLDFGLAHAFGRRKEDGGTPDYMAPEQCRGAPEDERTDVFALGVILYRSLTGELPFADGGSAARRFRAPAAVEVPGAPGLGPLLARMLARDPVQRPRDGGEVLEALAAVQRDLERRPATGPAAAVRTRPRTRRRASRAPPAIAVLPFVNLSAAADDAHLGDALAEEVIGALARIEGLRVVARSSSFAFRGQSQDLRRVAQALNVQTVLEGSVQRAGDRLRVGTQLVDAAGGFHLWAERFDRRMEDVFAIQDEIARNVARALSLLLAEGARPAGARPPADVRAYDFYLRGRHFVRQTRRASLRFAGEMFARACEIDPGYALAHAGTAEAMALLGMYYPTGGADLALADAESARALELAPDLAEAHAARGLTLFQLGRPEEAERTFERAEALDPGLGEAFYYHGRICFQAGRFEEAARLFQTASRVREDHQAAFFAAQATEALGRHDEARALYARALEVAERYMDLNPDDPRAATGRGVSLCRLGRVEEGLRWAEQALAIDPQDAGVRYNVACLCAQAGRIERSLDLLQEAVQAGFGTRAWLERDPDLAPLRGLARFEALLAGMQA
ncbi:MAG TPA: protein kinase [Anaeromyxobacteraceae bacterium]|nr:protein kinase [Anaeromyxobacteraceae bacterium]